MYNFTEEQIKQAKGVLITYPGFGTLYMHIEKVLDGYVEGLVWDDSGSGSSYLPDDYRGQYEYMNFPISYIKNLTQDASAQ